MTASEAFGVFYVSSIAAAVAVPPLAAAGAWRGLLAAAVLAVVPALVTGLGAAEAPAGGLALAALTLFSFGTLLAGIAGFATAHTGAWAPPLVAAFGLALLASPFLTDALLEDAAGEVRPLVREITLHANPAMWIAGADQLGVDWLRRARIYEMARLGAYHRYAYPTGALGPLVAAVAGVALALAARRPRSAA